MKHISQLTSYCLMIAVFFLPIHLNFNNIFLTCFIALSCILFFVNARAKKWKLIKQSKWLLALVSIPFLLNAAGLIYTDELNEGFDYTVRAIPFLCLPLISVTTPEVFTKNIKKQGYALVLGCLIVAIYSWSSAIIDITNQNKPWKELLGPLYSHHNLVKSLDLHAAYLSICIYTGIGFLITQYHKVDRKKQVLFILAVIILTLFMFHLLSRNAIIYFLLASLAYLFYYRKWKVLVLGTLAVTILGIGAYNIKHNYLRDRIFKSLNFFEKETQFSKKDDRFNRLSASYEVFKQKPIIGYGTAAESKHRKAIFKKNKDMVAYHKNYNAHNQFFEYLSTFGSVGGVAYILFFITLFFLASKTKKGLFIYCISGLFLACLTESIFERSQGVVYTALLIALLLSFTNNTNKTIDAG